ncbi:peptide/nickel transport system ATP-binding protein [Pullulanibacillus pueri]|uniref:Oligopeptide transport ATP-binding protein AppF n=1 Tax=Pullulanibacillus pueri TaxID=1437324 RepID=A0A8J2ZZG0_9BACL|nr:ABC transporter ATP-binding protein [Pullulanibacillus pueri]MBM7680484.1 peptide/nickel transport system ATP-binding protein [Pullulanibacillus pueri]GGH88205.1 oligopeptide transport ATP-binding protein AppF [Pullulanibacillus pueri]
MSQSSTLVKVEDLVIKFPVRGNKESKFITPVDKVNLEIKKGEVLALVGESGSGKTTIGRALVRLLKPTEGQVTVQGKKINDIKGRDLKNYRQVAQMIFQDPFGSLNPVRSIEGHLKFPLRKHQGYKGKALDQKVTELLLQVGLTPVAEIRKKHPHELSGGQRQRLAIARALAVNPKFIVADEPTSMLDVSIRAGILQLMNDLKRDLGLSYLYITHDLASARYFGDRIMVLYGGKVMEIAESKELIKRPLNPYTRLLLAATPGSDTQIDLTDANNEAPDLSEGRKGCPFVNRCPLATAVCRETMPELKQAVDQHFVACHHYEEVDTVH